MPEHSKNTAAILGIVPKRVSFGARIAMQAIVLAYVLTEPGQAVRPVAEWVVPLGAALAGVLLLLTVLSAVVPIEHHDLRTGFALVGFGVINGLIIIFAFDESQAMTLMSMMSLLEMTQLMPRSWLVPLTAVVTTNSVATSLLVAPTMGVEPHLAEVAIRASFCIGVMFVVNAVFRAILAERVRVQESEALFRSIFDHAPAGMALAGVDDQRLTRVNEAYRKMLGFTETELVGHEIGSLTIDEDFASQRAKMDAVAAGGDDGYRMTKRYRRKDGGVVTGDVATSLVRDPAGRPLHWIAQVNDVTDQLAEEQRRREAEHRYRALAENFPDGAVFVFDRDLRPILVAGRELEALGVKRQEVDATAEPTLPHALEATMRPWAAKALDGREHRADLTSMGRAFECLTVPMLDRDGLPSAAIIVAMDITARRDLEAKILHSNTELQHAVADMQLRKAESETLSELSDLLGVCSDEEEAHLILERMLPRLFPGTTGAIYVLRASRNLLEMAASWGGMPPDEISMQPDACWALRRSRVHVVDNLEREVGCPHVTPAPGVSCACIPLLAQGESLGILHLRCLPASAEGKAARRELLPAVAEQLGLSLANFRLRETLRAQSVQDPLTGLYNRRFMTEFLDRQLHRAQRNDQSVAVLMIDVDHLKAMNDTFGHEAGDRLLEDVARVLAGGIRGGDVACRYGGDEFTVVATDAGLRDGEVLAERLRASFRSLDLGIGLDASSRPDLSIGVASAPDHGWDADELLRAADQALYRAKAEGRGRTMVAA